MEIDRVPAQLGRRALPGGVETLERGGCIEDVANSVGACAELLSKLREVNRRLRGPVAEEGRKMCHHELAETYNILGI